MIEKANMQEGKSKYGWHAKMYVEMLFRLLSLPFIFQTLRKFNQNASRRRKDVKLSGYTIEGHYYKRCPNCGCKTAMEKEE